jgi:multisubunit Na+/H+ antiporter MnhB subunit
VNHAILIGLFLVASWGWVVALFGGAIFGALTARGVFDLPRLRRPVQIALGALVVGAATVLATIVSTEEPSTQTNWARHPTSHSLVYLAAGATVLVIVALLLGMRPHRGQRAALAIGLIGTSAAALFQLLAFLGHQNFIFTS